MKIDSIIRLSVITIACLLSTSAYSQYSIQSRHGNYSDQKKFNVFANCGYFFGGKITDGDTRLKAGDAMDYTVGFGVYIKENHEIALSYTGVNPKAYITSSDPSYNDITMRAYFHYFQLGSIQYYDIDRFHPFYSVSVGAQYLKTKYLSGIDRDFVDIHSSEYNSSSWMFAATAGVGAKIDILDNLGIKIEGRLLLPMSFSGLGVGINIGSGGMYPSISLNSYSLMIQGDISLGAYYKF